MNTENRKPRSKQYSKEELLEAIEKFDNDKVKIAEYLGIGNWALREQLKRQGINFDKRIDECKSRTKTIPPKEELIELYYDKNMSFVDIGKHYNLSNVTVRKWFKHYDIEVLSVSVSETAKQKVIPKLIKHNQEKYGVDHYYQTDDFKQKAANTCMERYNHPFYPVNNTSKSELEVLEFLNSFDNSFNKHHLDGVELDCYSEKLNIAVEYCGLYFHREESKGQDLHRKKYDICVNHNIRLFTVFEDEWFYRKDQVKNYILRECGYQQNKISAENLTIKVLLGDDDIATTFLNDNDIVEYNHTEEILKHYALMDNDDVLYMITISKVSEKEILISRFCEKQNLVVINAAQKILDKIKTDFVNFDIIYHSDNRWSDDNKYLNLGFTLLKENTLDYSYVSVKGKVLRKSKQDFSNDILKTDESTFDYDKVLELGWSKIWDCGNKFWIYTN